MYVSYSLVQRINIYDTPIHKTKKKDIMYGNILHLYQLQISKYISAFIPRPINSYNNSTNTDRLHHTFQTPTLSTSLQS